MKLSVLALVSVLSGASFFTLGCPSKSPSSPSSSSGPTSVLYLYGSDTTAAGNFQTLLDANGYGVTAIAVASVGSLNYGAFGVIIISDDSASSSPWGNTTLVNAIKSSNKPVLGLDSGGAYFFDTAGATEIGWNNAEGSSGTSVNAVSPSNSIWSNPNAITTSGSIALYSATSSLHQQDYGGAPAAGTTLVGQNPSATSYYPLASYYTGSTVYFLWGFQTDPSGMTTAGKNLFINVMKSL